ESTEPLPPSDLNVPPTPDEKQPFSPLLKFSEPIEPTSPDFKLNQLLRWSNLLRLKQYQTVNNLLIQLKHLLRLSLRHPLMYLNLKCDTSGSSVPSLSPATTDIPTAASSDTNQTPPSTPSDHLVPPSGVPLQTHSFPQMNPIPVHT